MRRRRARGRRRRGQGARSSGAFLMENKHSTKFDFRQGFSRRLRGVTDAAPKEHRHGAGPPQTSGERGREPPPRSGKRSPGRNGWRSMAIPSGRPGRGCCRATIPRKLCAAAAISSISRRSARACRSKSWRNDESFCPAVFDAPALLRKRAIGFTKRLPEGGPRRPVAVKALTRLLRFAPALRVTAPFRRGDRLTMDFADRAGPGRPAPRSKVHDGGTQRALAPELAQTRPILTHLDGTLCLSCRLGQSMSRSDGNVIARSEATRRSPPLPSSLDRFPRVNAFGVHTSHRACRRPPGAPFSAKRGRCRRRRRMGCGKRGARTASSR